MRKTKKKQPISYVIPGDEEGDEVEREEGRRLPLIEDENDHEARQDQDPDEWGSLFDAQ